MYHYEKPFSKLGELGLERSKLQAVGFYIVYLVFSILLGGISGMLYVRFFGNQNSEAIIQVGSYVGIAYCLIISFLIAFYKDILSSPKVILCILLSGALPYLIGSLGGLLPAVYLSTLKNEYSASQESFSQEEK